MHQSSGMQDERSRSRSPIDRFLKRTEMHYILLYELSEDYLARRSEFRAEHLKLAWQAQARGELILGGALADPADTALLLFSGDSAEPAERFAVNDPYVQRGLVKRWSVRQWTTVVGTEAATPVKPTV